MALSLQPAVLRPYAELAVERPRSLARGYGAKLRLRSRGARGEQHRIELYVGHWRARKFAPSSASSPSARAHLSGFHAGVRSSSQWALSLWIRNPLSANYAVVDVQPRDALEPLALAEPRSIGAALCGEF